MLRKKSSLFVLAGAMLSATAIAADMNGDNGFYPERSASLQCVAVDKVSDNPTANTSAPGSLNCDGPGLAGANGQILAASGGSDKAP